MESTLKYITEFDSFSTLDILFLRNFAAAEDKLKVKLMIQYLKSAEKRVQGLRVIRSMAAEFIRCFAKSSREHLMILFLTSAEACADRTLSTRSLAEACLSEEFVRNEYTNSSVGADHRFRPVFLMAGNLRLTPGFVDRIHRKFMSKLHFYSPGRLQMELSHNRSVTLDLVVATPEVPWMWGVLARNPSIDLCRLVNEFPGTGWTAGDLSMNPGLTADLVNSMPDADWYFEGMAFNMNCWEVPKVAGINLMALHSFQKRKDLDQEFVEEYLHRLEFRTVVENATRITPEILDFAQRSMVDENGEVIDFDLEGYGWAMIPLNRLIRDPEFTFAAMDAYGAEKFLHWCDFSVNNFAFQDRLNFLHFLVDMGLSETAANKVYKYL